jgi:hypothetical protein
MKVVTKCKGESGHGWTQSCFRFYFYPTFLSRFRPVREWHSIRHDDWHSLDTDSWRPANLADEITHIFRAKERFRSLTLLPGGPEVIKWLRENASGKVHLRLVHDASMNMWNYSNSETKRLEVHCENATDAVAFKLALL